MDLSQKCLTFFVKLRKIRLERKLAVFHFRHLLIKEVKSKIIQPYEWIEARNEADIYFSLANEIHTSLCVFMVLIRLLS